MRLERRLVFSSFVIARVFHHVHYPVTTGKERFYVLAIEFASKTDEIYDRVYREGGSFRRDNCGGRILKQHIDVALNKPIGKCSFSLG